MTGVDAFGRCMTCGKDNPSSGSCINCQINEQLHRHGMAPYKCPTCDGTGKVSRPPWLPGDVDTWTANSTETFECVSCQGKGILWGPP